MTAARRLQSAALLVVAAALLVPTASAQDGLTASSASYQGGAELAGEAVAFFLSDDPSAPAGDARPVARIDIRAARLEALQVEQRFLVDPEAAGLSQPVPDPRFDAAAPPARTVLEDAHARLDKQVTDLQMHLIPAAGLCAFTSHGDLGEFTALDSLMLDAGRFDEARPAPTDVDTRGDDNPGFWGVRHDSPVVRTQDLEDADFTFTGDLVLEFLGGTLDARDRDEHAMLESGVWREPYAPATDGLGLPVQGLESERTILLRVFLTDATVRIDVAGDGGLVFLAAPAVTATVGGEAVLGGATGRVLSQGVMTTLEGEAFTVPQGSVMTMRSDGGALALDVEPAPATEAGTPAGLSATGWPGQLAILLATLAVGAAVTLALLRRRTVAHADLRAVEAAIEHGRYGRAARVAKRVLRAQPGLEDAVLGRAIALSKDGRAGTAIAELHEHLARHGASDGSLHYVLGLSFLDVGRTGDARAALSEAVRLTPALAGEVEARLAAQASSPHQATSLREVHGYA